MWFASAIYSLIAEMLQLEHHSANNICDQEEPTYLAYLKRGVNPEFLNFWNFTVRYIKVYIFVKVMSHRIHFWYYISPNMLIFWHNHKNHFFGTKFLWQANKSDFELKCSHYWKIMSRQKKSQNCDLFEKKSHL